MTEEHLDRMIRDADPYRPDVIAGLDGAKQTLLEEIMSESTLDRVADAPQPRRWAGRGMVRRFAGGLTAAAVLTGVLAVSATLHADPDERRPAPAGTAGAGAPIAYSPVAMKAAEDNPRLLINQPDWKVTTVYGFAKQQGTIVFSNGGRKLEMTWYTAGQYDDYHTSRLDVSAPEPVQVDNGPGELFRYSADDFAVMLPPRDSVFVEMRTAGGWTRDGLDRVLAGVVHVDVRTWLAALPAEVVTPARVDAETAKVLADVPLPPNFDPAAMGDIGTNDPYQFGVKVTSRVGCAWIAEWLRAKQAGDGTALQRAADALRGSHHWRVLNQMNDTGDWPVVFWQIADKVAAGQPPAYYAHGLGCD
jgi:hypothetical protein